jgi:hypothetical protein
MSLRVGGLLVITGVALALGLGTVFVVLGMFLAVCGGLVAATGMETAVARDSLEADAMAAPVHPDHDDVAA